MSLGSRTSIKNFWATFYKKDSKLSFVRVVLLKSERVWEAAPALKVFGRLFTKSRKEKEIII